MLQIYNLQKCFTINVHLFFYVFFFEMWTHVLNPTTFKWEKSDNKLLTILNANDLSA